MRRKARAEEMTEAAAPGWSNAVELTTLEAAGASPVAVTGYLVARPLPLESRAAQRRRARPEKAQEPNSATAKAAL